MLCAVVLQVNIQHRCFLHNKHFSVRPHPDSLESACLEWMTCCVVWLKFRQHKKKKQLRHSSIACPGLPFLNNLSRQLEWLFYEYALKIPFLCSFSLSLCMSVCAQVCVHVIAHRGVCVRLFPPPETKEVSGRISPPTTERPESLEMHHRFCWVAHEPRCLPLPLCFPSVCPPPSPPLHSWVALTRLLEEDKAC